MTDWQGRASVPRSPDNAIVEKHHCQQNNFMLLMYLLPNREAIAEVSLNCISACISHFQLVCGKREYVRLMQPFQECKFIKVGSCMRFTLGQHPHYPHPQPLHCGDSLGTAMSCASSLLPLPFQLVTIASFLKNPADDGWEEEEEG